MDANYRIQFEKPDLTKLIRDYTVVDMHFHTRYSDGINSVDAIARRMERFGIGCAITDHNDIRGAVELDRHKHLLSIPGIEVTSREGTHVLVYFYDIRSLKRFFAQKVQPHLGRHQMSSVSLTVEDIICHSRDYNSVIIVPHPYSAVYTGVFNPQFPKGRRDRVFEGVDGIEAINGFNLHRWNMKSALLAFNLGKSITGGSDGHGIRHLGRVVTIAQCRRSRKSFLDALVAGRTRVIGKEINLIRKVTSNGVRLKTNIFNYPNLMEKNIRYSYTVLNSKSKVMKNSLRRSLNGRLQRKRH